MIANYEFTVLLSADDEKMQQGLAFVKEQLAKAGAEITKEENLGVKTLAYRIGKAEKANYYYFELAVDTQAVAKVSREFELSTLVLKYLFVNPAKI